MNIVAAVQKAMQLFQSGQWAESAATCQKILQKQPKNLDALHLLGMNYYRSNDFLSASQWLEKAIKLEPTNPQIRASFALVCLSQGNRLAMEAGKFAEALVFYDKALRVNPRLVDAWNNGGLALEELGRYGDALQSYNKALESQPDHVDALTNRAALHNQLENFVDAERDFLQALALDPSREFAVSGALWAALKHCHWDNYAALMAAANNLVDAEKPVVDPGFFLNFSDSDSAQYRCAKTFYRDHPKTNAKQGLTTDRQPKEKICLAYISADFREHPMTYLIRGLIANHDRDKFHVIGISLMKSEDEARSMMISAFDEFIDAEHNSVDEIVRILKDKQIDIAIDLMGYTINSRWEIFLPHSVPVQVQYMGFPGTLGGEHIDYIIADKTVIPADSERYYSENIVYMPDTYWVTDSQDNADFPQISRADVGLPEQAFVFCCFNAHHKITPPLFDVWMRLLKRVEHSVLWLFVTDENAKKHLRQEAARRDVEETRLIFADRAGRKEHIGRIGLADLMLDTLPYNAHTTTSDALWRGVPVVTCMGTSFASRVAASLLRAVDLPELISEDLASYEELSFKLANTPSLISSYKKQLTNQRYRCALFDTARFCKNLERAYVEMWQNYQLGKQPAKIDVAQLM